MPDSVRTLRQAVPRLDGGLVSRRHDAQVDGLGVGCVDGEGDTLVAQVRSQREGSAGPGSVVLFVRHA